MLYSAQLANDSSCYSFVLHGYFPWCCVAPSILSPKHFYQHIDRVLFTTITFVFAMFIFRPTCLLSSDSSCSIYVVIIVVFLCIQIYHQHGGDWWDIIQLSSLPSNNLTFYICSAVLPRTGWVRWCPPVLLHSWSWFCHSLCILNIFKQARTYRENHCFTMLPCTV